MTHRDATRRAFLGTTSAAVAGAALAGTAEAKPVDASKILNYNPKMGYRPFGKTGHMISEVALGGHGAIPKPTPVDNRVAVLERAVALGMNYVDNNIDAECNLYGQAMAKSTHARRDKWFIGFASWPQKVTEEYEKQLTPDKMMASIEARLKSYRTDMLDLWRPVGATWGKGQTRIPTMLMVSRKALDMTVGVFEKARQQGKVRFLGISAHNPKVFRRVLGEYPQFSAIIFPYLFLTQEMGGDSLLKLAQEKGVGVIGLKPFGAGTTFGIKPREIKGTVDARAHVLVKEMLQEKRLSAVIPGVNIPEQLEENVKGSHERDKPTTPAEKEALRQCTDNYFAHLPPDYRWLREWETV
ncbi:MAG: aldo/keto reductase [Candidatus Brocadiae bacterium]|nr:aldo/keto reductase [Candidatus Brocadiia bacterium]